MRLPAPEEKEKPLDVYSATTLPTMRQFDVNTEGLGLAGVVLRVLVGSRMNDYYTGPPWLP